MEISISDEERTTKSDPDIISADLIEFIASKLSSIEDLVRFGAVRRSWRSASLNLRPRLHYQSLSPWKLLITNHRQQSTRRFHSATTNSPEEIKDRNRRQLRFHSAATNEIFQIDSPEPITDRRCWGSPYGWIFVEAINKLINPISRASITLPNPYNLYRFFYVNSVLTVLRKFQNPSDHCLVRAVLTASPDSPDCIVFLIYSKHRNVGYLRPGDHEWTRMRGEDWSDIVYFKGKLYGCLCDCKIVLIDDQSPAELAAVEFAEAPEKDIDVRWNKYLVDAGGELCVVIRGYRSHKSNWPETDGFFVYKLDIYTKMWERVLCIGDNCIFVGANYSYSVSRASSSNLRGNCVYFSDDYSVDDARNDRINFPRMSDSGVYSFEKQQVTTSRRLDNVTMEELYFPNCSHIWFTPTLN